MRTLLRLGYLLLLLGWMRPVAAQPATADYAALIAEAQAAVQAHLAEHNLPGMAIAVSVRGETIWSEGFGYADLENRLPIWPTSRFRVGSISKPITAAAVAQLAVAGKLDLDAPVQQYVPAFPEKAYTVTTRQLGAHLGGIRHYRGMEFLSSAYYPTVTEGLAFFKDDPLLHAPGSKYQYSSYGWNLISAAIEGASGGDFLSYIDAHVFRPLGMTRSGPDLNTPLIPQRVRFYMQDDDGHLINAPYVDNSYKWAGGGFLSTAEDLLRFANAHLGEAFLGPEAKAILFTEQQTTAGEGVGYGFGWSLRTRDDGHRYIGHTGGSVGGTSVLMMQPDTGVVLVALVNMSSANLGVAYDLLTRFVEASTP